METNSFIKKLHTHLFSDKDEIPKIFNEREQEMIFRYRSAFAKWLSEPHLRDVQMINYLVSEFSISRSQAYSDLTNIKSLLGNVTMAGKEFQRYRANEMILQGFELAKQAKTSLDIKKALALIRAGEALVKVHKLESNDLEPAGWEDIIPLELEPSTDVSVIGRKPIENLDELKHKLRVKYGTEMN